MAHRFRKSTGPTRLGKKARALMRWSLEANLVMLGAVAAIAIALSLLLLVLPTSELHAQTNSAPSVSRVSPSSPVSLTTGGSQTFQVSATDADNNLTKWEWEVDKHLSFLHGHQEPQETFTATGSITKSFSHTFPDNGTYTVTVTFTDSDGESGTAEWRAEVEDPPNRAPSVRRLSSRTIQATGESLTFEASASDPDDNLKSYEWTVDGTSEDDGSWLILPTGSVTKSFTRTFSTSGEYTVEVTFTDEAGLSESVSWTVYVDDPVEVQFSQSEYRVNEGDGEAEITITISQSPSFRLTVPVAYLDGTAVRGRDYGRPGPPAIFEANTTDLTGTVSFPIYDDRVVEADESFPVWLFTLGGGSSDPRIRVPITSAAASVVIVDNDKATMEFERDTYQVTGQAGAQFALCVRETGINRSEIPITVHFSYTDPDGALSSGPASPVSVVFRVTTTKLKPR